MIKATAFDLNVHSSDGMHTINDNQLPASIGCSTVSASTPKKYTCASSASCIGLRCHADRANQMEVSFKKSHWPIILHTWKRALTIIEFVGQEILERKLREDNYYSDDDFSAHCHSDSDILATVEKADFVEFMDDHSSTLAGSEGDLDT